MEKELLENMKMVMHLKLVERFNFKMLYFMNKFLLPKNYNRQLDTICRPIYQKKIKRIIMKMSEAYPICKRSVNIPFKKLFSSLSFTVEDIKKNKGKAGQLLEILCGLELKSNRKDFEDGELKTSEIKESTNIIMITNWIDNIIHNNPLPFDKTPLAEKIEHLILCP